MSFEWDFPYPSQRTPLLARNVVATSQPLAVQAGVRMLLEGGNAVDAVLAAAMALTVVEPTHNGIGSDAFAILWDGQRIHSLNASGRSPRAWNLERFQDLSRMPLLGWDSVTIPGAVSAWVELSRRFGKLPFARLFAPAVEYAEKGFLVSPRIAAAWGSAAAFYQSQPDFARTFLPQGRAPQAGELVKLPDHGNTLREIAETQGESFYRGRLAEAMARYARQQGGALTADDLAAHAPSWVEPISMDFAGVQVLEIPPNGQGIAALMALGILRHTDVLQHPPESAEAIHLQLEAMKMAFAEAHRHVSDPASMKIAISQLLDDGYLRERAAEIDPRRARQYSSKLSSDRGTVYLTAADQSGMVVSYIQSNFWGFGSGVVVPGTGIALQNRGAGFVLDPNHPNAVAGGKRPYHTIIPALVMYQGRPLMSFGVMGGHMQPQGHVQVLLRVLGYHQNPQAALDAPRWHVFEDFRVALERGFPPSVVEALKTNGQAVVLDQPEKLFGGGQIVYRLSDGYCAASDPRKDGMAGGY